MSTFIQVRTERAKAALTKFSLPLGVTFDQTPVDDIAWSPAHPAKAMSCQVNVTVTDSAPSVDGMATGVQPMTFEVTFQREESARVAAATLKTADAAGISVGELDASAIESINEMAFAPSHPAWKKLA